MGIVKLTHKLGKRQLLHDYHLYICINNKLISMCILENLHGQRIL
jgi:hypothetical protein